MSTTPSSATNGTTDAAVARTSVQNIPSSVWSFEDSKGVSFSVTNSGLDDLASPKRHRQLIYTADAYHRGSLARRLASAPLPGPVPIGESRTFEADLGVSLIGGEYELRFGLERADLPADAPQVHVDARSSTLRVKNQIMDAFVELINACNFRCTFCPQVELKRKQRPMDFDLATKCVSDLADMGHHHPIMVHLLGEPLLYPRFFDFVDMAHDHGQRVHLVTNGSRFSEKTIQGIYRTGLDKMLISLNTAEEEAYNEQRGTNISFDRYMSEIRNMVREIVRRGAPPTVLIQVLYDREIAHTPEEINRVNGICADWANLVREELGQPALAVEEVEFFTPPLTKVWLTEGLGLQFMPYHEWGGGQIEGQAFCSYPWRQLAVLVDGQATACCVDSEGEIFLGDARTQSIEEIWNGPILEEIRRGFWNDLKATHPKCATCTIRHTDIAKQYRSHEM